HRCKEVQKRVFKSALGGYGKRACGRIEQLQISFLGVCDGDGCINDCVQISIEVAALANKTIAKLIKQHHVAQVGGDEGFCLLALSDVNHGGQYQFAAFLQ